MIDSMNVLPAKEKPKVQDTITLKRTHFYALILTAAILLGIIVGYGASAFLNKKESPQSLPGAFGPGDNLQSQQSSSFSLPTADDDPSIGLADAPVTIIEFSDFQCPYCKLFHDQQTLARILEAYPSQVRFVYRDFPVSSTHPEAQAAAEAAQCANEQGAFWKYHDALFQYQYKLSVNFYFELADQLDLNRQALLNCMRDGRYTREVANDFGAGLNAGITGTPTFFINDRMLEGAHPFEDFKRIVDEELEKARKATNQ